MGSERELAMMAELLAAICAGGSAAPLVRGEAGVVKSALLQQLIDLRLGVRVQIVRAVGCRGEVDLPYAGPHQLCRPMTDKIGAAAGTRNAKSCVLLSSGGAADRYIVGLATLSLLSDVAARQPVLWRGRRRAVFDPATNEPWRSSHAGLGADSVRLVFASR